MPKTKKKPKGKKYREHFTDGRPVLVPPESDQLQQVITFS